MTADRVRVEAGGRLLVDGVAVDAPSGTLTAVIGPNGAGKSTLLRALAGVERPADGEVRYGAAEAYGLRRRERAKLAALVEQDATTELDLTVADAVALGRLPHEGLWGAGEDRDEIVAASLDAVGARDLAARSMPTLSGGERQRVLIAKALAQRTPLLLLDEPTNHLDVSAQLTTLRLLRRVAREGATVLAALHDLGLAAAYADRVIVLDGGRVVAAGGTLDTLTPALMSRVYGVDAELLAHPRTGRPVLAVDLPEGAAED
ncbi:MAG TPA: ABC transporter ATP-binding protein [Naasia sp.]|jgi:iron complex transport system ATP-binding protein